MYTPRRNQWPPLTLTPRSKPTPSSVIGKMKAAAELPGPPVGSLDEGKGNMEIDVVMESRDDWQRFKEVGLLDNDSLVKRDREVMVDRVSQLQKELHDYQYTMGLLLLEKNEYTVKCGELSEAVKEAQEIINREKGTDRIVVDEVEKRVKNLREALDAEKQNVANLERALRETCFEYEQVKLMSDSKLSDATALINGVRDKSNDIEEKLHAAEAMLAEANSKSLELDRKLQEIEFRESHLKREKTLFNKEEAPEASIQRSREGLQQWERTLQEGEERLCESRRLANQREEKVNDLEKIHKQHERELEEKKKSTDLARSILKEKEEKLSDQLVELTLQEEKIASIGKDLKAKERELNWLRKNLSSRETVIQDNIDEYKRVLDSKKHEFELELRMKREAFDDEIRKTVCDLKHREAEFSHKEEKSQKQEQVLEKKLEKFKANEKEMEVRERTLKPREKSLKTEKSRLELAKKEIILEKECLETCKNEIEKLRADVSEKKRLVREETERVEVNRDEKAEHFRVLEELKQEIGRVRNQQDSQFREGEILKKDRKKSKEEWKELDEKIAGVGEEMQKLDREKELFEKERQSVEEKLNREKHAIGDLKRREFDSIRLEKESFAASMIHEQISFSERAENGHRQLKREYERLRNELETDMQNKKEEMIKNMQERRKAFKKTEETYVKDNDKLKKSLENEIEEMKSEKQRFKEEKDEVYSRKKELEEHQRGIEKDISELFGLSTMVKNQREIFMKERSQFLGFVERLGSCRSCSGALSIHVNEDQLLDQESRRSKSGTSTLVRCASRLSPIDEFQSTEVPEPSEQRSSHKAETEIKEGSCSGKIIAEKPAGKSTRKRNHGETSNTKGGDNLQLDDSKEHSESVTAGGHRKRRNTGTLVHQNQENKRYNLRRKKATAIVSEADEVHDDEKTIKGQVSVDGGSLQVKTCRKLEIHELSSHRVVESMPPLDSIDEKDPLISPNPGASDDDYDSDEDENLGVGKKI